jgi:lauroyl/myristoyl acyltransferase
LFFKYVWWFLVTLLLSPIFILLIAFATLAAFIPLNQTLLCRKNLRDKFGASVLGTFFLTVGVYLNYAIYALEALVYWRLGATVVTNKSEYFKFLGLASKAYGLRERRKGFLFLGAHYCVIEQIGDLMNQYLRGFHLGEVNVLYKPAKLQVLEWLLDVYRRSRRFRAIRTGKPYEVTEAISKCFERGDSLALVADQKPKKGGVFIKFFGSFAAFPHSGVRQSLEHPVVCVANTARRIIPGIFRVEYALMPCGHIPMIDAVSLALCNGSLKYSPSEIWNLEVTKSLASEDTLNILSHYAGWLESVVRKGPSQWCWDYRKWSRIPE